MGASRSTAPRDQAFREHARKVRKQALRDREADFPVLWRVPPEVWEWRQRRAASYKRTKAKRQAEQARLGDGNPGTVWSRDLTGEGVEPNPGPRVLTLNVTSLTSQRLGSVLDMPKRKGSAWWRCRKPGTTSATRGCSGSVWPEGGRLR